MSEDLLNITGNFISTELDFIEKCNKEKEDLQQRIDKAIEYIEDYKDQWCRNDEVISDMNHLISILKGEQR